MATIIEGTMWVVSEAAAERMVVNGLLKKCNNEHLGVTAKDLPIYHRACDAPEWFGLSTMEVSIRSAELHAQEATNAEQALVQPTQRAPE